MKPSEVPPDEPTGEVCVPPHHRESSPERDEVLRIAGRERDPKDPWSYVEPAPPEDLAKIRLWMLKDWPEDRPETVVFTCDDCGHAPKCSLVFEGYNTDGDCLASK